MGEEIRTLKPTRRFWYRNLDDQPGTPGDRADGEDTISQEEFFRYKYDKQHRKIQPDGKHQTISGSFQGGSGVQRRVEVLRRWMGYLQG